MPKAAPKANVFIIESLNFDDEQNSRFEGRFLSQILHLSGKESAYYYVQTKTELEKALRLFKISDYRYLHISCHGNESSIFTTLEPIYFSKLSKLMEPYLHDRRLFISACRVVNDDLASAIIPSSKCYSIIGPVKDIDFADAAIVWASFYFLVFKEDSRSMDREGILSALQKVADAFELSLNYFSIRKRSRKGYRRSRIDPRVV